MNPSLHAAEPASRPVRPRTEDISADPPNKRRRTTQPDVAPAVQAQDRVSLEHEVAHDAIPELTFEVPEPRTKRLIDARSPEEAVRNFHLRRERAAEKYEREFMEAGSDEEKRAAAVVNLGRYGGKRLSDELLKVVSASKDPEIRAQAHILLSRSKAYSRDERLQHAKDASNFARADDTKAEALKQRAKLHDPHGRELLAEADKLPVHGQVRAALSRRLAESEIGDADIDRHLKTAIREAEDPETLAQTQILAATRMSNADSSEAAQRAALREYGIAERFASSNNTKALSHIERAQIGISRPGLLDKKAVHDHLENAIRLADDPGYRAMALLLLVKHGITSPNNFKPYLTAAEKYIAKLEEGPRRQQYDAMLHDSMNREERNNQLQLPVNTVRYHDSVWYPNRPDPQP